MLAILKSPAIVNSAGILLLILAAAVLPVWVEAQQAVRSPEVLPDRRVTFRFRAPSSIGMTANKRAMVAFHRWVVVLQHYLWVNERNAGGVEAKSACQKRDLHAAASGISRYRQRV